MILSNNNRILNYNNNKIFNYDNYNSSLNDVLFGWNFEGATIDVKGVIANGIESGANLVYSDADGKINKGIYNGGTDFVKLPYNPIMNITTAFTISIWIKKVRNVGGRYLISKTNASDTDNNWSIAIDYTSGYVQFYETSQAVYASSALLVNDTTTWHHIVYTYDGTTFKGYLDGSNNVTVVSSFTLQTSGSTDLRLLSFSGASFSDVKMDMVYVWNRGLTTGEVATLYNSGSGLQYPF